MRLCSWPIIIFDFLFMSIQVLVMNVTNEQNVYPQLLSFKQDTQTILEMYYLLHWHTNHLNCLLHSISPHMLHSQSTYQTKVLLCQPTCIHTLQAQVGEKCKYKAIKHFSNSFPVYRLPVHTNVDTDTPLRQSHNRFQYCCALHQIDIQPNALGSVLPSFLGLTLPKTCTILLCYTTQ